MWLDRRQLSLEAEDTPRNERLLGEEARIVNQEASGEVIRSIQYDVVIVEQAHDIVDSNMVGIGLDGDLGVERRQHLSAGFHFWHAHGRSGVQDLALEIRKIDDVAVRQSDLSDTSRSQVEGSR